MSLYPFPDLLGVQNIRINDGPPVPVRKTLRIRGGVAMHDNVTRGRSEMQVPDDVFRTLTFGSSKFLGGGERTLSAAGFGAADLVRLDASNAAIVVGFADASVPGAPSKPFKYVANVSGYELRLRPPEEAPDDPEAAGTLLVAITLQPDDTVRIVWDSLSLGYRILGASPALLLTDGVRIMTAGGVPLAHNPQ